MTGPDLSNPAVAAFEGVLLPPDPDDDTDLPSWAHDLRPDDRPGGRRGHQCVWRPVTAENGRAGVLCVLCLTVVEDSR